MTDEVLDAVLQHYGVLGMKWGVRRKSSKSEDYLTVAGIKRKKLSEMSNDELKKITARMDLERRYKDLNPSAIKRGKKVVANVMASIGKIVGAAGTIGSAIALGKKMMDFYNGKGV